MNYQIIQDEDQLRAFIDWLPALKDNEKYYCCLFARRKYCPEEISSGDKTQLKRFLATKDRLLNKIKQLEVKLGAYELKKQAAPQASLALYINPNPRDLKKATYDGIIRLTQLLKKNQKNFNPHAELLNCIQQSAGKKVYLDFDVDTKDFDFKQLESCINTDCLTIVETRGGYHILVEVAKIDAAYHKSYYNNIVKLGVDQTGDQLLPVVGCVQGGFMPKFVALNSIIKS